MSTQHIKEKTFIKLDEMYKLLFSHIKSNNSPQYRPNLIMKKGLHLGGGGESCFLTKKGPPQKRKKLSENPSHHITKRSEKPNISTKTTLELLINHASSHILDYRLPFLLR